MSATDDVVGRIIHSYHDDLQLLRWLHAEASFERDRLQAESTALFRLVEVLNAEAARLRREVEFEANALETHGEWFGVDEPLLADDAANFPAGGDTSS